MSNIKISSNLFLGTPELKRLQKFVDESGFRKNILDNSVSFGLIKNDYDPTFANGKIIPDADLVISGNTFKTIRHNELFGIDKFGNFLYKEATGQLPVPDTGLWYWIRISHEYSNIEQGTWSLSSDGILSGTGGELLTILRGQPNFPSKIRFVNSSLNTLDYDILSVTDDNNAVLNGVSFQAESDLKIQVVGTFTYGASIDPSNKLIFNYDSCLVELIEEDINAENVRPSSGFEDNRTFYIARIKVENDQVIVQDKRIDHWETKASYQNQDVDVLPNAAIGIENIKYNHSFTAGDKNIVELAWSFRSQNWSINSTTNTLTMSSGNGGKFKTVEDFTNGDFNGWRLYAPDGTYSKIISSVKQGNAINLQVDLLDIDHYSNDGGLTFLINEFVVVTPNAEEIEITFTPEPTDDISTQVQKFDFQINKKIGRCDVLVYKDPSCNYIVSYRYKTFNKYSPTRTIPSDTVNGFYNETSFDDDGNLLGIGQTTKVTYTSSTTAGFITLLLSPNAYSRFVYKVDKGDLIGVNHISDVTNITNLNLIVGESLNYLLFTGALDLTANLTIQIASLNQVSGNEFKIHFNCSSIALNGFNIIISAESNGGAGAPLRTLGEGDFYQMLNIDNGIIINCICEGSKWYATQNYDLGRPNEIITIDGVLGSLFDLDGLGKVKGLFGYGVCDGVAGRPDLRDRFLLGQGTNDSGDTGGSDSVTLVEGNLPEITLNIPLGSSDAGADKPAGGSGIEGSGLDLVFGGVSGSAVPIDITNPYYAVIYAKKLF